MDTGPTRTRTFLRRNSVGSVRVRSGLCPCRARVRVRVVEFSYKQTTSAAVHSAWYGMDNERFQQERSKHCLYFKLTLKHLVHACVVDHFDEQNLITHI